MGANERIFTNTMKNNLDMDYYESTANKLRDMILKLIPDNKEILEMSDPFDLFKIKGFKAGEDLTLYQAMWALSNAKKNYYESL